MKFQSLTLKREGGLERVDGFPVEREPLISVPIGRMNRGNMFVRVGIGSSILESLRNQERVLKGSFMRTDEKHMLVIVDEQPDPYPRVGMLLYAQPGFRGSSMIVARNYLAKGQIWDSESGALGVGSVCLAIVQPGDEISVIRTGRLYGAQEEYLIRVDQSLNFHAMTKEEKDLEKEAIKVKGEIL